MVVEYKELRLFARLLAIILCFCTGTTNAADINWNGWSFDWSTNNNSSGLVLTDVHYNQKKILGKASLPVMRVKYANDLCGPYVDILSTSVLTPANTGAPDNACNNQSVCTRTFSREGEQLLEIGSNWQIGEYQIYQAYYFSEQGYFDARIYSRGLQCLEDHDHHPNWMFDFDIDGPENDQIFSNGIVQSVEFNEQKNSSTEWSVKDRLTGLEVSLSPSAEDGRFDSWSPWDAAGRKFADGETTNWRYGGRTDIGELFLNNESIDGEDIVFWYIAHLKHSAAEGSDIWHASGPRIRVVTESAPQPEQQPLFAFMTTFP